MLKRGLLILLFCLAAVTIVGQVELVPAEHRVYDFLRRMDAKGLIDFNSAVVPVSRREVSLQLSIINRLDSSLKHTGMTGLLSKNDRMLLEDFCKEFEYEMKRSDKVTKLQSDGVTRWVDEKFNMDSRLKHSGMTKWVEDNKYLFKYVDTNVAVWGHLSGGLYFDNGNGDSVGARKLLTGDLGFEVRGTMFDRVGFSMSYSNGKVFSGNAGDKIFANTYDAFFRSATSLKDDGKFFDHFKGYIRYEVPKRWLAVMVGKENVKQGFGFVDNLFFSGIEPYPMFKLDLKYKAIAYTFSYGNIIGDSAGVDVPNKMISTHRVDLKFAKWLRAGFYESVITSNTAFSFVHFNPISFIISADLNTGGVETFKSNSLMGFDVEVKPVRNVVLQGTLLVDDFNMKTFNNNDRTASDNKFGYQAGVMWNDALMLDGLSGTMEYTRLGPFVYSHRDNKQQYTDWGYSMGHQLPPNSDEIAFKFGYNVLPRLYVNVLMQFQRSGEGFTYDSLGNIDINYGGNINHGERFGSTIKDTFLQGNRVNRSIFTLEFRWEPVRQWSLELKYLYKMEDLLYAGRKTKDGFLYLRVGVKI